MSSSGPGRSARAARSGPFRRASKAADAAAIAAAGRPLASGAPDGRPAVPFLSVLCVALIAGLRDLVGVVGVENPELRGGPLPDDHQVLARRRRAAEGD